MSASTSKGNNGNSKKEVEGDKSVECKIKKLIASSVSDDTVVMTVPARASLLEGKEYEITVGEIKRRMSSPERLNVNDLLKILKESKVPENSKNLRKKLEEQGIVNENDDLFCSDFIPTGFLSLSEGEAKEMAEDFEKIMNERFPVELFALHMAHAPGMTIEAAEGAVFVSVFALS
uniref:TF_AP-2 domain-containing protein n=1 Tax=Syphacia muris TaxID=451379 RepID=A0A0N5ACN1_9BILA